MRLRLAVACVVCLMAGGRAMAGIPARVPVVGCPSDGQQGPQPAPMHPKMAAPRVDPASASRLAWYASDEIGVLAPRGWRCLVIAGSNGETLVVTPERHGSDLLDGSALIHGDVVIHSVSFGGTSGRFEVAEIASGLFPIAHDFVKGVVAEWPATVLDPVRLSVSDHVLSRTATRVDYRTAANRQGLGTRSLLAPSAHPVRGVLQIDRAGGMDLTDVRVRLPAGQNDLADTILGGAR